MRLLKDICNYPCVQIWDTSCIGSSFCSASLLRIYVDTESSYLKFTLDCQWNTSSCKHRRLQTGRCWIWGIPYRAAYEMSSQEGKKREQQESKCICHRQMCVCPSGGSPWNSSVRVDAVWQWVRLYYHYSLRKALHKPLSNALYDHFESTISLPCRNTPLHTGDKHSKHQRTS